MMKLILAFLAGFLFCTATIALDDLMYEWGEYQRPGSGYFTREAENGICDEEDRFVLREARLRPITWGQKMKQAKSFDDNI